MIPAVPQHLTYEAHFMKKQINKLIKYKHMKKHFFIILLLLVCVQISKSQNIPVADFTCTVDSFSVGNWCCISFNNNSQFASDSVDWSLGDGYCTNTLNPVHCYFLEGWYPIRLIAMNPFGSDTLIAISCIIFDSTGCYSCCGNSIVLSNPIDYLEGNNIFEVYPNPMNTEAKLVFSKQLDKKHKIRIVNLNGSIEREIHGISSSEIILKKGGGLKSGIYLIELYENDLKIATKKLIVN